MPEKESPADRIMRLIRGAASNEEQPPSTRKGQTQAISISVSGGNVHFGDNYNQGAVARAKAPDHPFDDRIGRGEEAILRDLMRRWVSALRQDGPGAHGLMLAWIAVQDKAGVRELRDIRLEQMPELEDWLKKNIELAKAGKAEPLRLDGFREHMTLSIRKICRKLGDNDLYRDYADETFGVGCLTRMTNKELQHLWSWAREQERERDSRTA